ncbi:hypothetical protein TEQG_02032 [Trichophyton equinum CBS 127.97]|uniref:Uncharacterized protein n=1 Tax=Trichophyton equinum (strain ATCC MYA-4606 / CBS 127.97) TaxID=559882 RepID=F2PM98_TRIEC|nr:hypothetical protein TEQG_02032 [Trichophyton equinum CBS 127.97]
MSREECWQTQERGHQKASTVRPSAEGQTDRYLPQGSKSSPLSRGVAVHLLEYELFGRGKEEREREREREKERKEKKTKEARVWWEGARAGANPFGPVMSSQTGYAILLRGI